MAGTVLGIGKSRFNKTSFLFWIFIMYFISWNSYSSGLKLLAVVVFANFRVFRRKSLICLNHKRKRAEEKKKKTNYSLPCRCLFYSLTSCRKATNVLSAIKVKAALQFFMCGVHQYICLFFSKMPLIVPTFKPGIWKGQKIEGL